MKRAFFAILAVAAIATACSKSESVSSTGDANTIGFRTVIDKSDTKATLVPGGVNTTMTSFFVQAGITGLHNLAFMEAAVYNKGTAAAPNWTYSPGKYWPTTAGTTVDFFAYAPIKDVNMTTAMSNAAGGTFGYTVVADQSVNNKSVDLLVANAAAQTSVTASAGVALAFNHALSAVTFSASNQNAVASNLIVRIKSIEITALNTVGTFTYPWSATCWSAQATPATYKAGIPAAGVSLAPTGAATYVNLLSDNDLMMILPQTITPATIPGDGSAPTTGSYVKITYNLTDATGAPVSGVAPGTDDVRYLSLATPPTLKFVPGTRYNFQFNFTGNMLTPITFTVTVIDWTPIPPADVIPIV